MRPVAQESVRHALKIRQALRLDSIVTDTRPIKATNLALDITKTNEIINKNFKTGKMTVVVTNIRFSSGNRKDLKCVVHRPSSVVRPSLSSVTIDSHVQYIGGFVFYLHRVNKTTEQYWSNVQYN
jgi:hypothetical protein